VSGSGYRKQSIRVQDDPLVEKAKLMRSADKIIAKLRMQVNEVSYSPTSLAEALGLDLSKEGYSNEYKEVYSHGLRESSEYQDRSRWISESLEFSHWIGANESSFLLIQENATQEHTSPLSFFQSLLYPKLAESTNVLVLSFFCGRHTGSRFPDSGEPSGVLLLARSLLVQILGVMTIDWDTGNDGLSFLSLKPEEVKRMDRGSVAAYTRLTSKLISALLAQFVGIFVMIDGVDFYDLAWEREVKFMVKSLLKLADLERDASLGVLKVLFTTSTHANASWSKSDKVVIIDMSDKIRWERDSFEELDVSKEWLVA
jgi:hypothetical protein